MTSVVTFLTVVGITVAPFALIYLAFNGLFAWDDRRWRKGWDAYRAADVPRPAVLGNVAPRGATDQGHATDLAAEVAAESTEVASDD